MDFFPKILDFFLLFTNAGQKFKNFDLIDFYILAGLIIIVGLHKPAAPIFEEQRRRVLHLSLILFTWDACRSRPR
jgi:hypothetical protein